MTPPPARVCRGVIVITGMFNTAGTMLTRLDPIHCYARHSLPIPNQPKGEYVVETTYADGTDAILFFDALNVDDAGHAFHGFFEITQPVSGAIVSVRIASADGAQTFAEIPGANIIASGA
jgi:hypothetical protein